MKYAKRKGDPKVKCLLVTKRERWVDFLDSKKAETQTRLFTKSDEEAMMMARHSQTRLVPPLRCQTSLRGLPPPAFTH